MLPNNNNNNGNIVGAALRFASTVRQERRQGGQGAAAGLVRAAIDAGFVIFNKRSFLRVFCLARKSSEESTERSLAAQKG
jgi:hypothetical protein